MCAKIAYGIWKKRSTASSVCWLSCEKNWKKLASSLINQSVKSQKQCLHSRILLLWQRVCVKRHHNFYRSQASLFDGHVGYCITQCVVVLKHFELRMKPASFLNSTFVTMFTPSNILSPKIRWRLFWSARHSHKKCYTDYDSSTNFGNFCSNSDGAERASERNCQTSSVSFEFLLKWKLFSFRIQVILWFSFCPLLDTAVSKFDNRVCWTTDGLLNSMLLF